MPKYQIIGTGKFGHIKGESGQTTAVSENKAFSNVAFKNRIKDDYYYFKSTSSIKLMPESKKGGYSPRLTKWIERQI